MREAKGFVHHTLWGAIFILAQGAQGAVGKRNNHPTAKKKGARGLRILAHFSPGCKNIYRPRVQRFLLAKMDWVHQFLLGGLHQKRNEMKIKVNQQQENYDMT